MTKREAELIERFAENSLDEHETSELRALIGTRPDLLDEIADALLMTGLARWSRNRRERSEKLQRLLRAALAPDASPGDTERRVMSAVRSAHARQRFRNRFLPLAVAAGLLAALGAGLWLSRTALQTPAPYGAVARVESVQGSVFGVQDAASRPRALQAGDDILVGMRIETGADSAATLAWLTEDATVELAADSKLETRSSKRSFLKQGQLSAAVGPLTTADLFTIDTPNARAEVLGTRFRIQASQARSAEPRNSLFTRLDVEEGRVRLIRLADSASVETPANRFAVAAENVELKAYEQGTEWIEGRILFADDFETDNLAQWNAEIYVETKPDEKKFEHQRYSLTDSMAADRAPFVSIEKSAGRKPGSSALAIRIPAESEKFINLWPPSPGKNIRAFREEFDLKFLSRDIRIARLDISKREGRSLPVDSAERDDANRALRSRKWVRFRYDSAWKEDDQGENILEVEHYINGLLTNLDWYYPHTVTFGQLFKSGHMLMDNYTLRELVPVQSFVMPDISELESEVLPYRQSE